MTDLSNAMKNNDDIESINQSERNSMKMRLKSKGRSVISNYNGSNRTVYISNPEIPDNMPNSLIESVVLESMIDHLDKMTMITDPNAPSMAYKSEATIIYKKKQIVSLEKAMKNSKYKKMLNKDEHSHGFLAPYTKEQQATWVIFLFNICYEYVALTPLIKEAFSSVDDPSVSVVYVVVTVSLALMDLLVVVFAVFTTRIDPSDPLVKYERFC